MEMEMMGVEIRSMKKDKEKWQRKGKPKAETQKVANKENSQPDVKKDEGGNKGTATDDC